MEKNAHHRDYSTISPSAKSLLLMKGHTNIPFARQVAEAFFKKAGFVIDKGAEPDYSKMSSLHYILKNATQQQLDGIKNIGKIHTTWRLKVDHS